MRIISFNPTVMGKPVPFAPSPLHAAFERIRSQVNLRSRGFWGRAALFLVFLYVLLHKDISIDLEFQTLAFSRAEGIAASASTPFSDSPRAVPVSSPGKNEGKKRKARAEKEENLGNTFSNMLFDAEDVPAQEKEAKRRKMKAYVKLYSSYAREEMKKHGIPASITLAQGLLESDAGESRLAVENNNHFGIKCFSRSCRKGHCTNYTDDTHKDFFRKYKSPSESFHAHSTLLKGARYKSLFHYKKTDFVSWAKGLKEAGYATDPKYDQKLINLIRELELDSYDR